MLEIFFIVLICGLLCLWAAFVLENKYPRTYKFFEQGMIWFGVLFVIGLVVGIFAVPGQIIDNPDPAPYFSHIFDKAVPWGIFGGALCGAISACRCKKTPLNQLDL